MCLLSSCCSPQFVCVVCACVKSEDALDSYACCSPRRVCVLCVYVQDTHTIHTQHTHNTHTHTIHTHSFRTHTRARVCLRVLDLCVCCGVCFFMTNPRARVCTRVLVSFFSPCRHTHKLVFAQETSTLPPPPLCVT